MTLKVTAEYAVKPPSSPKSPSSRPNEKTGGAAAVIVAHGMGQQIPFQTLDEVAQGLIERDNLARPKDLPRPKPVARTVALGDERMSRLKLKLFVGGASARSICTKRTGRR